MTVSAKPKFKDRFWGWFLEGYGGKDNPESSDSHQSHWFKVMCLTGVDYFSTLGYQPGIAFLAASYLSPIATLILVILTLFGALPVYKRVAHISPHGQGSIAMLERLLPSWQGKTLVLVLLGFAATDFIITITLSAADAAAHVVQNPFVQQHFSPGAIAITIFLLLVLGGIFLLGFREAIGVCFILTTVYLLLNLIVVAVTGVHLLNHPVSIDHWLAHLTESHSSPLVMVGLSFLLFPKLALGLSGFETGVAVMPLVRGQPADTEERPDGRIANTRKLLTTAAMIMSFFLVVTSVITTVLIPALEFQPGGKADGRALAYLAHEYMGEIPGSIYDVSTITILWFAGASAMAGLLNLVPRYLPRYGMAPDWARAVRPLVVFFTVVSIAVTLYFKASVDAQGSAYATGVLVLITSAAFAVSLNDWNLGGFQRLGFLIVTIVFIYTTIANVIERPEGLHIAAFFIGTILLTSFTSRVLRSTELRIKQVVLDETADEMIEQASRSTVRIVAHRPGSTYYQHKLEEACETHNIEKEDVIFLEVSISDASEFSEDVLRVKGMHKGKLRVLKCHAPAVPNAIAALLLHIRDKTEKRPHVYFGWTEGNPILYILKFFFLGEGETAPVTREILREFEPEPKRRPYVHVG